MMREIAHGANDTKEGKRKRKRAEARGIKSGQYGKGFKFGWCRRAQALALTRRSTYIYR